MAEYVLDKLAVWWNSGNGLAQMPQVQNYGRTQEGGDVPMEDITHAGDTVRTSLDQLPNEAREGASFKAIDVSGPTGYYNLLRGSVPIRGTIVIFPRGSTSTYEYLQAYGTMGAVSAPETLYLNKAMVDFKFTCADAAATAHRFTLGTVS